MTGRIPEPRSAPLNRRSLSPSSRSSGAQICRWLIWGLLAVYLTFRLVWFFNLRPSVDLAPGSYHVDRVVDGDTLVLDDGTRVRLMGVDCPESVKPNTPVQPFALEAAEFTRTWLAKSGGNVRLEFDRERFDNHGRTLAFVWHDEQCLNEALLQAGLARWEANFSYASSMKTRFRKAEDAARQDQRGLWMAVPTTKP